jgi:hypothetical protein
MPAGRRNSGAPWVPWHSIEDVPGDMAEIMRQADLMIRATLHPELNAEAWHQEAMLALTEPPLPWPPPAPGEGFDGFVCWLAHGAVALLWQAEPEDPNAPEFQIALRMVRRAVVAARRRIRPYWDAGATEGWAKMLGWLKRHVRRACRRGSWNISQRGVPGSGVEA